MTPDDLLAAWEQTHGSLMPAQRQAFLRKPEVAQLCTLPPAAVGVSFGVSPRLSEILGYARSIEWWFRGEECEEDGLRSCNRCKPYPYPPVVVMSTGMADAFHAAENCKWLIEGQHKVAARGGDPAPLARVALQVAIGSRRQPCLACFPAVRSPKATQ